MGRTNPEGYDTWWMKLMDGYDFLDKSYAFNRYVQTMLRISNRMFKWNNLPETIPQRKLEEFLQTRGVVFITKAQPNISSDTLEKAPEGLYAFFGGYGGARDVYYEPTQAVIANPACPDLPDMLRIGQDCCVIFNDSQKQGLIPMFQKYAKLLVENDISIYDAEINLRIQTLIHAADDRTKNSAELYLQRIEEGKLGIISGASLDPETALATKPFVSGGNSNALSQLIEMHQYLKASLLNELGLNANYNMKRERINSAETELNNDGLLPLVDDMLEMRKKACEAINEMFGTDISVEKASAWEFRQLAAEVDAMNPEGVEENDQTEEAAPEGTAEPEAAEAETGEPSEPEVGEGSDVVAPEEKLVEAIEEIIEEVVEDDGTEETE